MEKLNSPQTLIVTRIHNENCSSLPDITRIADFVQRSTIFSKILVCIDAGSNAKNVGYIAELENFLRSLSLNDRWEIMSISPWGLFTTALNSSVGKASRECFKYICFQSFETVIPTETVSQLLQIIEQDSEILVIGPAFPGHKFEIGTFSISGTTCPWNTFAIWDVKKLGLTGFPLIGDGMRMSDTDTVAGDNSDITTNIAAGVEEVTAISLLQTIHPNWKAVLARVNGIQWEVNFTDPARLEYHRIKMASKDERPAKQLEALGIPPGNVTHIQL